MTKLIKNIYCNRNSKFLTNSLRRTIGDFGVPIAIFIMVLIDYLLKDVYTEVSMYVMSFKAFLLNNKEK